MISVPESQEFGLGYRFTWKPEGIAATINHLDDDHGDLKCEVRIEYLDPPAHIKRQRLNCSSGRAISELAKTLKASANHIDWSALLEQLAYFTIENYRSGNPPEHFMVSQSDAIIQPKFKVHPFIMENDISMVFAMGGSGKSIFCQTLYALASIGEKDNKLGLGIEGPLNIGYLDWESNVNSFKYRIRKLLRGMDLPDFEVKYQMCHLPFIDDLNKIGDWIGTAKLNALIIDSVGMAGGKSYEMSDPRTAISMTSGIRSLKLPVVLIHHTPKSVLPGQQRSEYGTVYWRNESRSVWEIISEDPVRVDAETSELSITLRHRKINDMPYENDMSWKYTFTPETITVKKIDVQDLETAMKGKSLNDRIMSILRDGAMTPASISGELEATEGAIRTALTRLKKMKKVVNVGENSWGRAL